MKSKLFLLLMLVVTFMSCMLVSPKVVLESVKTEKKEHYTSRKENTQYTVDFYYNDSLYQIQGDSVVPLQEILDAFKIKGKVSSYEVSNKDLFEVSAKEDVLYFESKQAFDTTEWLEVTIKDKTYRIVVEDDLVYIGNNNTTTVDIPGVRQGHINNFTENIPIATIFIDETKLNNTRNSRNSAIYGSFDPITNIFTKNVLGKGTKNHPGFVMEDTEGDNNNGSAGYSGRKFLIWDLSKENLSYSTTGYTNVSQKNEFPGEILTYKWEDAAKKAKTDGTYENLDVYITYSNLMITLEKDVSASYATMKSIGTKFGLWGGNMMTLGQSFSGTTTPSNNRYAYTVDVNVAVRDKSGKLVPGSYYYQAVDIDVCRINNNGYAMNNFKDFYGANEGSPSTYDPYLRGYSEQFKLLENFGDIFIPGATGDEKYKANIQRNADGTYYIYPTDEESGGKDNNTFYSGFVTLIDNTNGGLSLKYYGSSGAKGGGMETYILAGSQPINHELKSTTKTYKVDGTVESDGAKGGTIQTTNLGNHAGNLSSGTVIGPTTITTATGQTIVYTMTPKEGYKLKEVKVGTKTLDYTTGSTVTPTGVDTNSDGIYDYYTYKFTEINSDNAIHVEWEPITADLTIQKKTENADETFAFQVKLWTEGTGGTQIPYTHSTTPNNASKKEAGLYEFKLKNNGSVTFNQLPYGVHWGITEDLPRGWEQKSKTNATGHIYDPRVTKVESVFTNTLPHRDLVVEKKTDITTTENFTFTLKLWSDALNGTEPYSLATSPNGVQGSNGVYTLTIKGGEKITIPSLPAYVYYSVTEKEKFGWKLNQKTDDTGEMNASKTAIFENKHIPMKDITLKKTWDDQDNNRMIRPNDIEGFVTYRFEGTEYTEKTKTNQWAKNGNIWTYIFRIPVDSNVLNWGETTVPEEYEFTQSIIQTPDVYEMKNQTKTSDLNISHNVTGDLGDPNKNFNITVKIKNKNGQIATGKFLVTKNGITQEVTATNDGIKLTIKHDDKITIHDLLLSDKFDVEMDQTNYTGYGEVSTESGTLVKPKTKVLISSGSMTENMNVSLVSELNKETQNKPIEPPKTGTNNNPVEDKKKNHLLPIPKTGIVSIRNGVQNTLLFISFMFGLGVVLFKKGFQR